MNRSYAQLAVAVFLPIALAVILFGAASVSGQGDAERTPYAVLYDDGTWELWASSTPTGTHTPTPTSTPPATVTPTPTATATPGNVEPTPTPEAIEPTLGPSSTPVNAYQCMVGSAVYALNVRAAPSITAVRVSQIYNTDSTQYVVLDVEFAEVRDSRGALIGYDEWAQIEYEPGKVGWIAVEYWYNGTRYTYAGYPDLDLCSDIRFPPPITALGIRTVPGASGFDAMYPILASKSIPFGVSPYASIEYCTAALDAGGLCVMRPGAPDCPSAMYDSDPRENARDFMKHAALYASILKNRAGVWLEPINECMGSPDTTRHYAWWAEWMDAYIDEALARDWPPLALPSLPPGHGDTLMFSTWKPVLQKLAAHGGLFSMHAYTFNSKTDLCVCDPWEACRHVTNHNLMLEHGYTIQFTLTEAARWAGNAPVSVEDMACFYNVVSQQGFVHSVWDWLGGFHPVWPNANLDGYYIDIANAVG